MVNIITSALTDVSRIKFCKQASVAAPTPEKTQSAVLWHVDFNNNYTKLQLILMAIISNKIEICGGNDYHKEVMELSSPTDCNSSFKMELGDKKNTLIW